MNANMIRNSVLFPKAVEAFNNHKQLRDVIPLLVEHEAKFISNFSLPDGRDGVVVEFCGSRIAIPLEPNAIGTENEGAAACFKAAFE